MQRSFILPSLAILVVAGLAACAVTARATFEDEKILIHARLSGLNEVPPTNSMATGTVRGSISEDRTTISYTFTYSNLTGNPLFAHFHFGQPEVNGGVMVFLCGGGGKPACPAATSGTVSGTITAADIVGPAAQGILAAPAGQFSDVVRAILTGHAYANIHTPTFPGGEERGPVVAFGADRDGHD